MLCEELVLQMLKETANKGKTVFISLWSPDLLLALYYDSPFPVVHRFRVHPENPIDHLSLLLVLLALRCGSSCSCSSGCCLLGLSCCLCLCFFRSLTLAFALGSLASSSTSLLLSFLLVLT